MKSFPNYTEQFTPREQNRGCRVPEFPVGKCKKIKMIIVFYEYGQKITNK